MNQEMSRICISLYINVPLEEMKLIRVSKIQTMSTRRSLDE